MEVKDYISLSLARKLYKTGDRDLVNLALEAYSIDELDIPDYTSLITEYDKSVESNNMIRLQKINYILAAIAYKFYGSDKNYQNDFSYFDKRWAVVRIGTEYTTTRPVFGRIAEVYFASKEDANTAINYLNFYKDKGLI